MSRIILSKYEDGSNHVIVGWDHPARGTFWQEWATKEEIATAEAWMEDNCDDKELYGTEEYLQKEALSETGVKREGGMWPGIALDRLVESMPEELRPLMTPDVMKMLHEHADDPNSGYGPGAIVDLTI